MVGLRKPFLTSEFLIPMLYLTDKASCPTSTSAMKMKKRAYNQRVREVEHATFTPLVFSATGGLGIQVSTFYKRLASLLVEKWDHPYSSTLLAALPSRLLTATVLNPVH